MQEKTQLKINLLIHDLKTPLAVIDLGVDALMQRKAKYGPLTPQQESIFNHLQKQTRALRSEVNRAIEGHQNTGTSPMVRLMGILKRLTFGAGQVEDRTPGASGKFQPLDATQSLLLNIEAHLQKINQTAHLLEDANPETGGLTRRQTAVFRRLKRNVGFSLILMGNAKLLALPQEIEPQPGGIRVSEAIQRPLVEVFDLLDESVADQIDPTIPLDELKHLLVKGGLMLQVEAQLFDQRCLLDKNKFSQIVVNLLLNAFKFRNKMVWLSLRQSGQKLIVGVADDGRGMTPGVLDAVREKRHVAGPDIEFPVQGHGIGLAGARLLTEEMGGQMSIESTTGEGTKIWVTLPCVQE